MMQDVQSLIAKIDALRAQNAALQAQVDRLRDEKPLVIAQSRSDGFEAGKQAVAAAATTELDEQMRQFNYDSAEYRAMQNVESAFIDAILATPPEPRDEIAEAARVLLVNWKALPRHGRGDFDTDIVRCDDGWLLHEDDLRALAGKDKT